MKVIWYGRRYSLSNLLFSIKLLTMRRLRHSSPDYGKYRYLFTDPQSTNRSEYKQLLYVIDKLNRENIFLSQTVHGLLEENMELKRKLGWHEDPLLGQSEERRRLKERLRSHSVDRSKSGGRRVVTEASPERRVIRQYSPSPPRRQVVREVRHQSPPAVQRPMNVSFSYVNPTTQAVRKDVPVIYEQVVRNSSGERQKSVSPEDFGPHMRNKGTMINELSDEALKSQSELRPQSRSRYSPGKRGINITLEDKPRDYRVSSRKETANPEMREWLHKQSIQVPASAHKGGKKDHTPYLSMIEQTPHSKGPAKKLPPTAVRRTSSPYKRT